MREGTRPTVQYYRRKTAFSAADRSSNTNNVNKYSIISEDKKKLYLSRGEFMRMLSATKKKN